MRERTTRIPGTDGEGVSRRQQAVTWGLLVLAVFVSLGMAEWSKRTAASETVMDPAVLDQALQSVAKAPEGDKNH